MPSSLRPKVEVRTRAARAWLLVVRFVEPFIGVELARRAGVAGAWRLARWRPVGERSWRRFPREMHESALADIDNAVSR